MTSESTDLHPSHDWDEVEPDEDGLFCHGCNICTCHAPEESTKPCPMTLGL